MIVIRWLRDGALPEQHIYPTIRSVMARQHITSPGWTPKGLSYFTGAIVDAVTAQPKSTAMRPNGLRRGTVEEKQRVLDAERERLDVRALSRDQRRAALAAAGIDPDVE